MGDEWWEKKKPKWMKKKKKKKTPQTFKRLLNNMRKCVWTEPLKTMVFRVCWFHSDIHAWCTRHTKIKTSMYYRIGDSFLSFFRSVIILWLSSFFVGRAMDECGGLPEFEWPFMLCHVTKVFVGVDKTRKKKSLLWLLCEMSISANFMTIGRRPNPHAEMTKPTTNNIDHHKWWV